MSKDGRTYVCSVCGVSLTIRVLQGKGGLARAARIAGVSMDCRKQLVRDVMEE